MSLQLASLIIAGCFIACGVLFIRTRLSTRDEFFGALATTFLLLGLAQGISAFSGAGTEPVALIFLIRLVGFLVLIAKIFRLGIAK